MELVLSTFGITHWVPAGVNRPYDIRESVISKNNPKTQWYIRSGSSSIVAKGEIIRLFR